MNDQVSLKDELITVLADNLKNCQLIVSEYQQQQLIDYVLMMHKWNKAYNLTSVRDPHQMVIKHVIDSIVVALLLNILDKRSVSKYHSTIDSGKEYFSICSAITNSIFSKLW